MTPQGTYPHVYEPIPAFFPTLLTVPTTAWGFGGQFFFDQLDLGELTDLSSRNAVLREIQRPWIGYEDRRFCHCEDCEAGVLPRCIRKVDRGDNDCEHMAVHSVFWKENRNRFEDVDCKQCNAQNIPSLRKRPIGWRCQTDVRCKGCGTEGPTACSKFDPHCEICGPHYCLACDELFGPDELTDQVYEEARRTYPPDPVVVAGIHAPSEAVEPETVLGQGHTVPAFEESGLLDGGTAPQAEIAAEKEQAYVPLPLRCLLGRVKRQEKLRPNARRLRLLVLRLLGAQGRLGHLRHLQWLRPRLSPATRKALKRGSKRIFRHRPQTTRTFLGMSIHIGTARSTGHGESSIGAYYASALGKARSIMTINASNG